MTEDEILGEFRSREHAGERRDRIESEPRPKILLVRCGERAIPVGDEDLVVTLDGAMDAEKAKASVQKVREAIANLGRVVELRVAGPGMLVGIFAQAFEHMPVEIRYSQLNQLTKAYEVWFSNKENL